MALGSNVKVLGHLSQPQPSCPASSPAGSTHSQPLLGIRSAHRHLSHNILGNALGSQVAWVTQTTSLVVQILAPGNRMFLLWTVPLRHVQGRWKGYCCDTQSTVYSCVIVYWLLHYFPHKRLETYFTPPCVECAYSGMLAWVNPAWIPRGPSLLFF